MAPTAVRCQARVFAMRLSPYSIPWAIISKCSTRAVRGGDTATQVPPGTYEHAGRTRTQRQSGGDARLAVTELGGQLDGGHHSHAAPDLRDELVVGQRRESIEHRLLLLLPALDQAFALENRDVREPGGAARGVAGVGGAVAEDRSARLAPERLGDPLGDHHAAQRR